MVTLNINTVIMYYRIHVRRAFCIAETTMTDDVTGHDKRSLRVRMRKVACPNVEQQSRRG